MKPNNVIAIILFKVFAVLTGVGGIIIIGTSDISRGHLVDYLLFTLGVIICGLVAAAIYDYRIFARHIFAIRCMMLFNKACKYNKIGEVYDFLYQVAEKYGSGFKFYDCMLKLYDTNNADVITVKNLLERG